MNRRCLLPFAIVSVALMLASPLAIGQVSPPPFVLSSSPTAASIFPGEAALFTITIKNDAFVIDRTATMSAMGLPPEWLWQFEPSTLDVAHQSSATTKLTVFVPNGTAPQTIPVVYEANDSFGFTRATVNVTVKQRPTPTVIESGAAAPPRLTLSVTPSTTANSGTTAQGIITITHDDPARSTLSVHLTAAGVAPWNAYIKEVDQNRNLAQGESAQVPVFVDIPDLAENKTINVTIRATVGETVLTTRWAVTGLAAPDASGETGTPTSTTSGTGIDSGTSNANSGIRPNGPNFEMRVEPLEIDIAPNSNATASVKLTNTGSTELMITLSAPPPPTWHPLDLSASEITLAAGEVRNVPFTLHAPSDLPSGGTTGVSVSATAPGVGTRRADVVIHIIPGATPRDESPITASEAETPIAPEGSGLPSLGAPALIAVGLAAAGSGALILVSRPLREKLLWGAMGLYTRLARPDVLGHEDREKLYRLVEAQPGIHFHALQRDLAWNTGTLTYHVRVLEKHGFVVSRRDGLYRRFYLAGAAPRKETFENQGPTGLRADVVEAIRNAPGISQSDLALGLGANKQTVNYHVKALERAGTIRVEKRGRDTFLFADGATVSIDNEEAHA